MDTRIILALDELTLQEALELCHKVQKRIYAAKGHSLVDEYGPQVVEKFQNMGVRFWNDAKLHDIPNTVRLRAQAIAKSSACILTVHAEGEIEMMLAARSGAPHMEIYAITELTSLSEEEVHLLSGHPVKAAVLYRARLAKLAGMDGVVCSPQEVEFLAKRPELKGLKLVVPGSRSLGVASGDQKRVGTPGQAAKDGATHLVIGRQVTKAPDPIAAISAIETEIEQALAA